LPGLRTALPSIRIRTVLKGLRIRRRKREQTPTREQLAAQEEEAKRILYAKGTISVRRGRR
jgi:hypothetical protein